MKEVKEEIVVHISETQTIIELSQLLQPCQAEVYLKKVVQGSVIEVNLKSFLGLITLKLQNGDKLTVRALGEDCEKALMKVTAFLT
ncbi:HPr family phosphocarrier protein [Bacillus taeanensis]|uniref:HPr family phosphocarrier protein n=1 Tax=Bacillus taeanensis TaxID=273032 RepID=A0A366XQ19_9BACI|nr:HPr family phosphocarrier protein [Bacillus taeanensis]RBW68460.1 HPr family phosphocarrier protein [Bacillus taeanensis]